MEVFNTNQRMKTTQALIESIDEGENNDVEIVLEDGVIKASKLILSSRSEYFERMFNKNSQFREQRQGSVKFPCKKLIMRKILEHLDGGNLDVYDCTCIEMLDMLRFLLLEDTFNVLQRFFDTQAKANKFSVKECFVAVEVAKSLKLLTPVLSWSLVKNLSLILISHVENIENLPKCIFMEMVGPKPSEFQMKKF